MSPSQPNNGKLPNAILVQVESTRMNLVVVDPGGTSCDAILTVAFDGRSLVFLGASVCRPDDPLRELVCLADGQGIVREAAATAPAGMGDAVLSHDPRRGPDAYLTRKPLTVCLDAGERDGTVVEALLRMGCDVRVPDPLRPAGRGVADGVVVSIRENLGTALGSMGDRPLDWEQCRKLAAAAVAYAAAGMRNRAEHAPSRLTRTRPHPRPARALAGNGAAVASGKGGTDVPAAGRATIDQTADREAAAPAAGPVRWPATDRLTQALESLLAGDVTEGQPRAGLLIVVGESRSGKTTRLREFARRHVNAGDTPAEAKAPVLMVEVPPHPGVKGVLQAVAACLSLQLPSAANVSECVRRVNERLVRRRVRTLILDEADHLLAGNDGTGIPAEVAWPLELVGRNILNVVLAGRPGALLDPGRFGTPGGRPSTVVRLGRARAD